MSDTELPNNDEELDAAMALAALVGGEMIERPWSREDRCLETQRSGLGGGGEEGVEHEKILEGISWSLRRRRSGSVVVVNEKGSPLNELSSKLGKMQDWDEKQPQGGRFVGQKHAPGGRSSNELSQSGLSEADFGGNSDGSKGSGDAFLGGPAGQRRSTLLPGVDQAKVERAFEQGLEGIAQLLKEDRPLHRAPSFPPQLSVNTLLPQLSLASQSGLQTELSLGLQSQRSGLGLQSQISNVGELQPQLSAPSAFLAAIAASLPQSTNQPWPSYHPNLANPFTNPLSNPITRTDSPSEYQYTESLLAQESDRNTLESPKLVDFLATAGGPSEGDESLQDCLERGNSEAASGVLRDVKQEAQGLGFGEVLKKRLARVRRRKAAAGEVEEADPSREAQRLRRIQANRESARKTIMRKQAVCKQLSMEAQELGDANLDLRSKVSAAQKELEFLISKQAKLRAELLSARMELSDDPSDVHTLASAPVLPDLSDDRRSIDGLPKPNQGLKTPPRNLDSALEDVGVGQAVVKTEQKEGFANVDMGLDNQRAIVGDPPEKGHEGRELDSALAGCVGGLTKGLGLGCFANPDANARSGRGSTGELGLLSGPQIEPLSKRGSDESVTAHAGCPPRKTNFSRSTFLTALGGASTPSVSGQPISHVGLPRGPPKGETLESGGQEAPPRVPLGSNPAERAFLGGRTEEERLKADGSLKGFGVADAGAPGGGSAREAFSGLLPDVSMTLGGESDVRGGENVQLAREDSSAGGSYHAANQAPGKEQLAKIEGPELPLSLSFLQTLATEFGADPPNAERDGEIDLGLKTGDYENTQPEGGASTGPAPSDNQDLVLDVVKSELVGGFGQKSLNETGPKALAHAQSLPPFPWLVSQPELLQRQLSAPMPDANLTQKLEVKVVDPEAKPAVCKQSSDTSSKGAGYPPIPEAGFLGQGANPGSGRQTQKADPHFLGKHGLDSGQSRGNLDGIVGEIPAYGLTRHQTSDGPGLSLGSASWRLDGGITAQPILGRGRSLSGSGNSFPSLQPRGSQGEPGQHWGGTWDGSGKGGSVLGAQWPPPKSGPGPAQNMDLSLGLQMAAPVRTVKSETGVYNVYRGAGRRGSVSLHIGPLPVVDAVTAAEARKRRREVTKSKFGAAGGSAGGKGQKVKNAKKVR